MLKKYIKKTYLNLMSLQKDFKMGVVKRSDII